MTRFASFSLALLLIAWACDIVPVSVAFAQPPEDSSSASTTSGPTVTVAPAGVRRHVPGKWATVAVNGLNKTDVDAVETAAVIIGDDSNQQYARRLWIPARSRRQSWLQVQIPDAQFGQIQVPMTSIHLKDSDTGEQFQSSVIGMTTSQRSLLLCWETSRAAVMFDRLKSDEETFRHIRKLTDTVYAARDAVVHSPQDLGLVSLGKSFLPPSVKALDALDQIVIASDLVLHDTVAVTRLRTFLQSGGRIWVMVDQVSPASVRALLGDAACYSVIDRVELNDFELQQASDHATSRDFAPDNWSSETPVDFVRVLVDTEDVHSRIDGWPAAFWKQVGHGEVLFTTLGGPGWLEDGHPLPSFARLAPRFFDIRVEPPRQTSEMISFLDDEIGYSIPSRSLVASILGMHMFVVLGVGVWLARRRRLQQLAIVVPVAALVATGTLLAIGNQKTSAVPSTIVTGQIARVIPESSEVQVDSIAAIYSQEGGGLTIQSSPETTTLLRDGNSSGEVRRILCDDSGESSWLFVNQPPGVVRHVESESMVTMSRPWNVYGRFTENGFAGRIKGLAANRCEDAVIVAAASPALAVDLQQNSSGTFLSGFDDVLSPDQFIDDKLISDVQQDRQDLLRQLHSPEAPMYGREPSMLVWTDPIDSGVKFDDSYVRRGSSVVSIPILLQRLPSGADFQVPASFVRLEAESSMVFNASTGRWLKEMNKSSESELRCVLPKVLLPCQLNRASLLVKINAPSRSLEIKCLVDGEYKTLHTKKNPTGLLRFEIDQAAALQLDADGALPLSIAITATDEEREAASQPLDPSVQKKPSRSTWEIDYVQVNLEGTTL